MTPTTQPPEAPATLAATVADPFMRQPSAPVPGRPRLVSYVLRGGPLGRDATVRARLAAYPTPR